tara:strand:- start:677 stop:2077 length:1401 start_codon:yes stop_codon:yes gene_type:complete
MPETKEWESRNWKWKNPDERRKKLFVGNVTDRKANDYMQQHGLSTEEGKKFMTRKRLPEFDKKEKPRTTKVLTQNVPKKPKDTNNEIAGAKRERDQAHADYQNIRSKYREYTTDKAESEEEPLDDLTDGKLEEIEKKPPRKVVFPKENDFESKIRALHQRAVDDDKAYRRGGIGNVEFGTPIEDQKEDKGRQGKINNMIKSLESLKKTKPRDKKLTIGDKLRIGQDDFDRKNYDKKIVDVNMFGLKQKMPKEVEKTSNQEQTQEKILRDDEGKDTLPKNYKGMAYGMSKIARGKKGKLTQAPHRPVMSEGDRGVENRLTTAQTKRQSDSLVHQMLHDPEEFKKRIKIPIDSKPKDVEMEQEKESRDTEAKIQAKDEPKWAKEVRRRGGKPIIRTKKSWKKWLVEKDSAGQGDARYGNPHETGMEDPRKLQVTRDDFNMEEKDDDNKPFIQRETRTGKDDEKDEQSK